MDTKRKTFKVKTGGSKVVDKDGKITVNKVSKKSATKSKGK